MALSIIAPKLCKACSQQYEENEHLILRDQFREKVGSICPACGWFNEEPGRYAYEAAPQEDDAENQKPHPPKPTEKVSESLKWELVAIIPMALIMVLLGGCVPEWLWNYVVNFAIGWWGLRWLGKRLQRAYKALTPKAQTPKPTILTGMP